MHSTRNFSHRRREREIMTSAFQSVKPHSRLDFFRTLIFLIVAVPSFPFFT